MKPVILTDPDDSRLSWLVDEHSISVLVSSLTSDHLMHYETAVALADLRPGEWKPFLGIPAVEVLLTPLPMKQLERDNMQMMFPHACVFADVNRHKKQVFNKPNPNPKKDPPNIKGIYLPAAVAMLQLAASKNNVKTDRVKESFTFNDPRIEDVPIPWNEWKFLTAWLWSDWKKREIDTQRKITHQQRWEEITAIGYPHGFKAFEAMHRSLFGKPTH
jgi:hypothetical protein